MVLRTIAAPGDTMVGIAESTRILSDFVLAVALVPSKTGERKAATFQLTRRAASPSILEKVRDQSHPIWRQLLLLLE